jgi:hypothetical protein
MAQERESLRDLDGVRVAVEELSPAAAASGLSSQRLQQAVEQQLREAGVRLLPAGTFPLGDPFLRVRVDATQYRDVVAYSVEVDFVQVVFLRRNPAVTFNRAETWKAPAALGIVEPDKLADAVSRALAGAIDQFVREYRAVN